MLNQTTPQTSGSKPLRETKPDRFLATEQAEVFIEPDVYDKIIHWVNKSPVEISGLGKVIMKDGNFHVISAYLLEQENGATHTDIDPSAVAKLMYESREDEGHLNFWWHSHVNMGCFWSGTDTETIRQLGEQGWCLATVFNKKEDYRSAYYQKGDDFMPEFFMDNMDTTSKLLDTRRELRWDEEYSLKCKQKTFNYSQWDYTKGTFTDKEFLTNDDLISMKDEELQKWWEDNQDREEAILGLDLFDQVKANESLAISGFAEGRLADLLDAFIDMYNTEPLSALDLNLFFTQALQGDTSEF